VIKNSLIKWQDELCVSEIRITIDPNGQGIFMRVIVFDMSGGIPLHALEKAVTDIKIGDYVLTFDHSCYDHGIMANQSQIYNLNFFSGGGTLFQPVIDKIQTIPNVSQIVVYTDGYIGDVHPDDMAKLEGYTFRAYPDMEIASYLGK
jgi:hypothetical protein